MYRTLVLKPVHVPSGARSKVIACLELDDQILAANFTVQSSGLNVNPYLSKDDSAWGLWESDVCEIFVAAAPDKDAKPSHYYEFQVSPLGQRFELEIHEPRVRFDKNYRSGVKVSANVDSKSPVIWTARMEIPLAKIGYSKGQVLVGNLFACLGKESVREYWSAFTPAQKEPDFHIPAHFQPLV